jgi:phosphatidate cytidylyltransferase
MVVMSETEGFLRASSTLTWGIITTVFSLGHLAYLLRLPTGEQAQAEGFSLFLYLIILTQLNDVAQFVFGKIFAYREISLKVSTTRTWASLIGGMLVTALLAWLVGPLLTPLSDNEAIVTGLLIALSGFSGYITLAALKSDLRFKDRGTMTPGRGGVLNRIDSLIYAAPLFFHLIAYWHYR